MEKLFNDLSSIENKRDELIVEICYKLLKKCERYDIKEVEVDTLDFYSLVKNYIKPSQQSTIKIQIIPDEFKGRLSDCFMIICPGERKIGISRGLDYLSLFKLTEIIEYEAYKKETDPYIKHEYFDKKKVHYENKTIIITDPCYCMDIEEEGITKDYSKYPPMANYDFIKEGEKGLNLSRILKHYEERKRYLKDIEDFHYNPSGEEKTFESTNYINNSTLYGDWSCTVYKEEDNEVLGEFCADSGRVGVFDLQEILEYNSGFEKWASEHPWCVAIIKDFSGDVWMEIEEVSLGDGSIDYSVHVVGKGSVNFKSFQTGL